MTKRKSYSVIYITVLSQHDLWSMPLYGGEGVYPIADACDYALLLWYDFGRLMTT